MLTKNGFTFSIKAFLELTQLFINWELSQKGWEWMLVDFEQFFFINWELSLKGFFSGVKMNVSTFWAIFLPLKSNTPGPFSIMLSSPLLKHNISFFIPRVCSKISIFQKRNGLFKEKYYYFSLRLNQSDNLVNQASPRQ